ncbi:hypothetical protein ISF_01194 [Cordyceps fumosorosea ARSEF 2679]|uniref:Uncharacterized protein n=1 Tax=Cordyceps fumosorosea (strain ARSEF 2679) TaxID=1081104 RepID=A0A168D3D0_CORFA|nr:hypothetical protein ISF_01194 [Cordyceps fumosorosea ARSEF 2679]OAA72121.1 hypothetical protein ISF_01194 [Cordyceps fumosorosea ARSEF 2679]
MDIPGSITLPKGILTNSSTVYDEVAAYSTLPADKVHQYWHVYTTTNKKLKDPTARRLENFWWHVWGSDRSKLSGPVLARIFEDISLGPTVVPLRGPPNRWEGPDAAPLTVEMIMAHIQRNLHNDAGKKSASTRRHNERAAARVSSSSALRPSQPPPILKKAGSSSTNVTRHTATARFVSPHESAEEDDAESDIPSSGNAGKEPSTAPARDKTAGGKQKATRRSQQEAASDHTELSMANPTRSLFTAATSSTTNVAVQGTIIDQSGSIPSLPQISISNFPRDEPSSHGGSSTSSLRETRLTPTQPSSSVVLPLGRTKSQLTLLLEREKERPRS